MVGRSWEYINRSHKYECGNWERGSAVSFLGIHKSDLIYSAVDVSAMPACVTLYKVFLSTSRMTPHANNTVDARLSVRCL
jgi:hypothetical protein